MGIFKSKPVNNTELIKCLDDLRHIKNKYHKLNLISKKVKN